jgi:hypothetical protein
VLYIDTTERKGWIAGYYLLICLAGFSILLGSPGPVMPISLGEPIETGNCLSNPGMGGGDITNCGNSPCHPTEYTAWSMTGHANHIVEINATHVLIGNELAVSYSLFDAECAECHASGYDNVTGNYYDIGVDCRACHDESWSEWSDYSGVLCRTCHNDNAPVGIHNHIGSQNPSHADSLADLRSSTQASPSCMYCHSTEAFIYFRNPDFISIMSPAVNTSFPVDGSYKEISCPACHAVHANWSSSPSMIRGVNGTSLCGICHSGAEQPMYDIWIGSSHHLAGVVCINCHGYDLSSSGSAFMNHTFNVDPLTACGQSEFCHQGMELYVLGQLEVIRDTYGALTSEILDLADLVESQVEAYSIVSDANSTIIDMAYSAIDDARSTVQAMDKDRSHGVHDWKQISNSLNTIHRELLRARTAILEAESIVYDLISGEIDVTTHSIIVTHYIEPPPGMSEISFVGGAVAGFTISIILGIIMGRMFFRE